MEDKHEECEHDSRHVPYFRKDEKGNLEKAAENIKERFGLDYEGLEPKE